MPFKSQSQRAYLYAINPKLAKEFAKKTSPKQMKSLPTKVKKKK